MGEDQDAAGARGLDEAQRGDGLAGAGRVLEPEALGGVGVLGRPRRAVRRRRPRRRPRPSRCGSSSARPRPRRSSSSPGIADRGELVGVRRPAAAPPLARAVAVAVRAAASASSAVSVPESASTWCGFSSVPSASCGSSSESRRSRPSSSENSRRQSVDGPSRPASSSASAASSARRRALPGASASARLLALVHEALAGEASRHARCRSDVGTDAAASATDVVSAMDGFRLRIGEPRTDERLASRGDPRGPESPASAGAPASRTRQPTRR